MKRSYLKVKRRLWRDTHDASPSLPATNDNIHDPAATKPTATAIATESPRPSPSYAPAKQEDSPLESLPAEVRHHVLASLGFEELNSLIRASPVYHQQYRSGRKQLLYALLENMLGGAAVDACAVFRAGSMNVSEEGQVKEHLEGYKERRLADKFSIREENLTEEDLILMVKFHAFIVAPLVRRCAQWALSNLSAATTSEHEDNEVHSMGQMSSTVLSQTETARLRRGFYRFQLCCSLFGTGRGTDWPPTRRDFKSMDILTLFLDLFEPWEREEIGVAYLFAKERFEQVFTAIKWDVDQMNPKFDDKRPPTPKEAFHLDMPSEYSSLLVGTVTRGLELLNSVFGIYDHNQLVNTMQEHMTWQIGDFFESEAWGTYEQNERRKERTSDADRRQLREDPMPFQGDKEDCPPLGWTVLWNETYSNLFGDWIGNEARRFGFVVWDAGRIEGTGAREVIFTEINKYWLGEDPREDMDLYWP